MQSIQPGVHRTSFATPPPKGESPVSPEGQGDRVDLQKGVDLEAHRRIDRQAARVKSYDRIANVGVGLTLLGALSFVGSVAALALAPPLAVGLLAAAATGIGIGVPLVNVGDASARSARQDNYL